MPVPPRASRPAAPRATSAAEAVVIGGCNVDLCGRAALPAVSGDSTPGTVSSAPGGVARNIAENLARLGHRVRLISAVGNDAAGRWLRRATAAAGVDMRGCRVVPGATSAHYLSLHGPDGALLQAVNDMAVLDTLTPESLAREVRHLRRATVIVVDANLREDTLAWLFEQHFGASVFADAVSATKAPRLKPWLRRLHTLKVNRAEAEALGCPPLRTTSQRSRAAAWFRAQGPRRLALSLGEHGLMLTDVEADEQCERPAWPVQVRNPTGAGDALMAGLVHARLAGWSLPRSAEFALGCAALTLTHESTTHPALGERAVRALQRRGPRAGPAR